MSTESLTRSARPTTWPSGRRRGALCDVAARRYSDRGLHSLSRALRRYQARPVSAGRGRRSCRRRGRGRCRGRGAPGGPPLPRPSAGAPLAWRAACSNGCAAASGAVPHDFTVPERAAATYRLVARARGKRQRLRLRDPRPARHRRRRRHAAQPEPEPTPPPPEPEPVTLVAAGRHRVQPRQMPTRNARPLPPRRQPRSSWCEPGPRCRWPRLATRSTRMATLDELPQHLRPHLGRLQVDHPSRDREPRVPGATPARQTAAGHFGYFGAAAGDPAKGYYSLHAGAWSVFVLNTGGNRLHAERDPGTE